MFNFLKQLLCLHEKIWWTRTNSYSRITKRSCIKCNKVERNVDVFGV